MSSNIYIKRLCEHCGKEFVARTTVTRFCSHTCNSRFSKLQTRHLKEQASHKQTIKQTDKALSLDDSNKEYFDIATAAAHMTVSERTLYRIIAQKKLKKKKVGTRTVITKEDIRIYFAQQ
jgi:excisionase family DNA binding protein